jgi:hypothetical protein
MMGHRIEDLTGRRFGILTALSYEGRKGRNAAWLVKCDCGTEKVVKSTNLKRSDSCGCLARQQMSARTSTHGLTRPGQHHPLYATWDGIKRRCHGADAHERYGKRGIVVCDRWILGEDGRTGFECFLADMGPKPSRQHSIDRIDNNGPYAPANCRWATMREQQRNRSSNRIVKFRGVRMLLVEAIERAGLKPGTVSARLAAGWSVDRALNTPAAPRRQNASAA